MNCNCEVKQLTHDVACNQNGNLWANSALATKKLKIKCLQKTCCVKVQTPFKLVFLPNACEGYRRNIYILSTVLLTNSDPTLTLLQ